MGMGDRALIPPRRLDGLSAADLFIEYPTYICVVSLAETVGLPVACPPPLAYPGAEAQKAVDLLEATGKAIFTLWPI